MNIDVVEYDLFGRSRTQTFDEESLPHETAETPCALNCCSKRCHLRSMVSRLAAEMEATGRREISLTAPLAETASTPAEGPVNCAYFVSVLVTQRMPVHRPSAQFARSAA